MYHKIFHLRKNLFTAFHDKLLFKYRFLFFLRAFLFTERTELRYYFSTLCHVYDYWSCNPRWFLPSLFWFCRFKRTVADKWEIFVQFYTATSVKRLKLKRVISYEVIDFSTVIYWGLELIFYLRDRRALAKPTWDCTTESVQISTQVFLSLKRQLLVWKPCLSHNPIRLKWDTKGPLW